MRDRYPRRLVAIGVVMGLLFAVLVVALANLQLRAGEEYGGLADSKKTKVIYTRGDRGMITDINSVILAQDKRIYDVCFYRDPTWNPGVDAAGRQISAYGQYTESIINTIEIVLRYGGEAIDDFALRYDPEKAAVADEETARKRPNDENNPHEGWYFALGGKSDEIKEFREEMWRANFFVKTEPIQSIFARLCERYRILDKLDWSSLILTQVQAQNPARDAEDLLKNMKVTERWTYLSDAQKARLVEEHSQILAVWQMMQMNAFLTTPIVIARNVSWETVIEIETRSMMLPGISIAVNTQRVYPNNTHMSHIVGYIGKIQSAETYKTQLKDKGYRMDDLIGLEGVEKSMEDALTANSSQRQGKRIVEIDRYGAVSRELESTPPRNGNNVKLTIDSSMQRVAEMALEETISIIRAAQEKQQDNPRWRDERKEILQGTDRDFDKNPIKLAEKGAVIVVDMQGRVLALASYPPYDPNAFIAGGEATQAIMDDPRYPLMNYAIQSRATPGSIFKMVTASAGMAYGKEFLDPYEKISDGGYFTDFDQTNPPRCWIDLRQISQHRDQTIVEGMSHSCNYFFYVVSARLTAERLYRYASLYGLTSKTNIDLPGELQSYVGNQAMLYDPAKAIDAKEQATWKPSLVKLAIKTHLQRIGRDRNITFEESKLDRAIKRLMDMAVVQPQSMWVRNIRAVLMEELDMSRELVYLQVVIGDIYNMLNEVRWGGSETIMAGIGQSITSVTPAAVARYVAAVANGGTVYDLTLIDSITSPDGEVISRREPVVSNSMPELAPYLPFIHKGMQGVVDDEGGTATQLFRDFKYKDDMAAKTGTAQVSRIDLENNAWFVAFAPYEDPEIAVVCYIPNGYGGSRAAHAVRELIGYYMDHRGVTIVDLMPAANSLAY